MIVSFEFRNFKSGLTVIIFIMLLIHTSLIPDKM